MNFRAFSPICIYLYNYLAKVLQLKAKDTLQTSVILIAYINYMQLYTGQGQEVQSLPLGLESNRAIDQLDAQLMKRQNGLISKQHSSGLNREDLPAA